jgi:hypothetical protein
MRPKGAHEMMKGVDDPFLIEAYVCWDRISQVAFLGIDNPPEPMSMSEAKTLLARCAEVHNRDYDLNLRIVPA